MNKVYRGILIFGIIFLIVNFVYTIVDISSTGSIEIYVDEKKSDISVIFNMYITSSIILLSLILLYYNVIKVAKHFTIWSKNQERKLKKDSSILLIFISIYLIIKTIKV